MPRRRTLITTTAVLTILAGGLGATAARADTGSATDLYVNPATPGLLCNDKGPGTADQPFCTIQPAADAVTAGQTVHIMGAQARYAPFTVTHSGTQDAPIKFVHAIQTQAYVHPDTTVAGGITVTGANHVSFSGINVTNAATDTVHNPLTISGSTDVTFDSALLLAAIGSTRNSITVDGTSSAITLSRLRASAYTGWVLNVQPGATAVVATRDYFASFAAGLGGIHADGVQGITLAGDTIGARCGSAVSITGDSSGSVENTVAVKAGVIAPTSCAPFGGSQEFTVSDQAALQVHSDYNVVYAGVEGGAYMWGGKAYATAADLLTGTGQGAHDINSTVGLTSGYGIPTEGAVSIDSGDASAPGELPTDDTNHAVVDDTLVDNTGTGSGTVDRGAIELQDPLFLSYPVYSQAAPTATVPVTMTSTVTNPWKDPLLYHFDFGDGTSSTPSASPSAEHTYLQPSTASEYQVTLYATRADDGSTVSTRVSSIQVAAVPEMTASIDATRDPAVPGSLTFGFHAASAYGVSGATADFGDGTPSVPVAGGNGTVVHAFPHLGVFTVKETATDAKGRTATATRQVTVGAAFVPVAPQRFLDTRSGIGAAHKPVGRGGIVRLKIAGVRGLPATGVAAVTLNLTAVDATSPSYVSAYPDGGSLPGTSNINVLPGQAVPNEVTVPVGADGYVALYNDRGTVDLIADVQGYFTSKPVAGHAVSQYIPTLVHRALDTRSGIGAPAKPAGPGSVTTFQVWPADAGMAISAATAVVVSITETGATAASFVTAYPGASTLPTASNLNFTAGQTTSNLVVLPIDSSGRVRLFNRAGHVSLIADVQGYYSSTDPLDTAPYMPLAPVRIADTRHGVGVPAQRLGADSKLRIKITGSNGVPFGARAVLINLTGVGATVPTFLTADQSDRTPYNVPRPTTSNLNLVTGQTRPVLALVPVGTDGYITVYNSAGSVDVIVDLQGYYSQLQ